MKPADKEDIITYSLHRESTVIIALLLVFAVLSVLPFVVSAIPMMPDLFNHIARYYLLYGNNENNSINSYFQVHWNIIGNLGMDIICYPFIKLFGFFKGAVISTALIPPLTILALALLSGALWGYIVPTIFASIPFVYSFTFLFGFTNYHISIAMAFIVLAVWIHYTQLRTIWRWVLFSLLSFSVWLAHLGGWVVLAVLAGSYELVMAWRRDRSIFPSITRAAWTSLPILTPIFISFIWRLQASSSKGSLDIIYALHLKHIWIAYALASENKTIDVAYMVLIMLLSMYLVIYHRKRCDMRIFFGVIVLSCLYLVTPIGIMNSWFADARMVPVIFMVLFISFAPQDRRSKILFIVAGSLIFLSRLGFTTVGWIDRGERAVADLAVLDTVQQGSRIAAFGLPSWQHLFPLSGMDELPSLEIIRKNVFVNTEWDQPGSQVMKPIYNSGIGFNDSKSTFAGRGGLTVDEFLKTLPRNRFDYVWSYTPEPMDVPWLKLVASAPDARLYKIDHSQ